MISEWFVNQHLIDRPPLLVNNPGAIHPSGQHMYQSHDSLSYTQINILVSGSVQK